MATMTTRIGPADHGRAMTLDEFREAEGEPGYRYELARGIVEVTKVPGNPHGQVVSNLYMTVAVYNLAHPDAILRFGGGSEFRLDIPDLVSGRNPDLGVLLAGASKPQRDGGFPSLVAEVVSARSGDRDYRIKREEYLACGVLEYWIVDPWERRLTLLTRDGNTWREQVCQGDQVIPSVILPDLAATVADLWVKLDRYEDVEDDEEVGPEGMAR